MSGMKTAILGFFFTFCLAIPAHNANAFILKCKAIESSYFMTGGYMILKCKDRKTGAKFYSEALEVGPGLRFSKYDDNGELINKQLRVLCPFMRSKKLLKMKTGDKLVVGGPVVDIDLFYGGRLGLAFGKPGVCFIAGFSSYEFGVQAGMSFLHLYRE